MPTRRHFISSGASFASALGATTSLPRIARAHAISKPARLLVGFPAGGSIDTVARLLADRMTGYAPSIVVENRAGAGGRLALEAVKAGEPDGALLVLTPGDQLTLFPHVYKTLTYDAQRDFTPVAPICTFPFVLAVGPMVPAEMKTVRDFVTWCRANPKSATYGTAGAGTRQHFLGVALAQSAGFDFVHLPYKGGAPALQDTLGGQIPATFTVLSNVLPLLDSGKLRALAITAAVRNARLPGVPTFRESGYPALEGVEWFGLLAAARTPKPIVDSLVATIHRARLSDELQAGLAKHSFEIAAGGPAELAASIRADTDRWRPIVMASGFKPID